MTLKQLLEGILGCDPFDAIIFLQWYVTKKDLTCRDCIITSKDLAKVPPSCSACGLPTAKLLKKHFKETKNEKD